MPTSFPGTDRGRGFPEVDFAEELLMGYRWYDAQGTKPQWPFGHGLSYATFAYSPLAAVGAVSPSASVQLYATVCNTAGPAGKEVAQLYVGYPAAANEPPKLLKGFEKISLGPGACGGVGFEVAAKDLWVWDVVSQTWQLTPGTYTLNVGSSSRDIRQTGSFTVQSKGRA
jgi:beta-glucosidase